MLEKYSDSMTWYVIFSPSYTKRRWWLHPKFQHVHVVRDNDDRALMVNSFAHVMAVREYPCSIESFITQEAEQGCTAILQHTVHYGSHYRPAPIELLTCVSVTRRILGISRGKTPKALYRELLKAGALVIKGYTIT